MKNFFEFRGTAQQLTFDPITKQFVARKLPHGFVQSRDALEQHLLQDLGIDTAAMMRGELKLAA